MTDYPGPVQPMTFVLGQSDPLDRPAPVLRAKCVVRHRTGGLQTDGHQRRRRLPRLRPRRSSRDKQNVRDGHYEVWGPAHILARTSNGTPVSTAAQAFLARFVTPRLPDELLAAIVDGALVPQCAMRVTRNEEVGALASFQPPYGCGCYFDQRTRGSTTCKACKDNSECPSSAPTCNFGYCEVR